MELIFLTIAAFFAGLVDSIAGGGGLLSLPALLAAGVPASAALGTNKFQSMCGTACALANFSRRSKVAWRVSFVGIPFSLVASIFGAKLAILIPQEILARILVVILPPAAVFMFISRSLIRYEGPEAVFCPRAWLATVAVCFCIGLYDGFFGPGTGTFLIVALVLIAKLPLVSASATAKTFNFASNAGALFTFILSGAIVYKIALIMAAANIVGNYIGSHYAMKLGGRLVQKFVFVSLSVLFIYLVWKYY